jgi:hypothetical protein
LRSLHRRAALAERRRNKKKRSRGASAAGEEAGLDLAAGDINITSMSDGNKKTVTTVKIAPIRFRMPDATRNSGMFSKDRPRRGPGRPPGSVNKITRTMKDMAVAAATELGQLPRDRWDEEAKKGDPDNGMKGFFKAMAVEQPKSLAIVLARLMPKPVDDEGNNEMFTKDRPGRGPGRPPGSVDKISRALQEAAIAAAEELGGIDYDKWAEAARKGDPDNGLKGFFKVIAVEEMRTFLLILARMLPKPQPAQEPRSPSHRAAKASHPSDLWSR